MNSYKKLVNNSMIFAVGTLGSKLVTLLLVPLYTYYLSTAEYGTVDLVVTTINMLLPIVSWSVFEAVLRFSLDKQESPEETLINSLMIALISYLVFILLYPVLAYLNLFENTLFFLYVILFLQILERTLSQYLRGLGEVKKFAINGVLLSFSMGLFNILFLVVLGLNLKGYFWAMIIAYAISIVYLLNTSKAFRSFDLKLINLTKMKNILQYSIPLVPNSITWWVINASSRYFISFYVGLGANGLYAVASRIPSVLNMLYQVFNQAWQLSAIEEYENDNRTDFFTKVFNYLSTFMFLGASFVIIFTKPIFRLLFAPEYFNAWMVTPFLLIGTVYSSFSSFLGTNYIAAKETKGIFNTSIYGGVISLGLNFLLIPTMGLTGAGISSVVSFIAMFIFRYVDTKKYLELNLDIKNLVMNTMLVLIQILVLLLNLKPLIEIIINLILLAVLVLINRQKVVAVFGYLKNYLIRKFF